MRVAIAAAFMLAALPLQAQTAADSAAIRGTALDYIEGWYAGDAARMERALHPQLAKRIVRQSEGAFVLGDMTAEQLVGYTRAGGGTRTPAAEQQKDVTILDIFRNAAVVKIVARDWVDYLQIAKWEGDWKIVNVLWETKQ
ncbi:MAG: nuclear transport factor 2 family protein [Gemmatimonadota bacterium]|nr:nuclear transport factor 2 family protein [Gemmatimonadota bacterium]